jgi:hypothetical protein
VAVKRTSTVGSLLSNPQPRIADGFRRHRVLLFLALALNLGDALTTQFGLSLGIPEGNPIPAMMLANGGRFALFGSKFGVMAVVLLAVCLLGRRYPRLWHTFTVTNLVLLAVVLSNSAQILAR